MSRSPVIGVTPGDPAGIGPELARRVVRRMGRGGKLRLLGSNKAFQCGRPTLAGAREPGRKPFRVSGNSSSQWMILDYGDVLVHIMHTQKRKFYRLEDLWGDAVRLES